MHHSWIRQKKQKGLGDAIYCAKKHVGDEPFAVLLGDEVYVGNNKPALAQLIDAYNENEFTNYCFNEKYLEPYLKFSKNVEIKNSKDFILEIRKIYETYF